MKQKEPKAKPRDFKAEQRQHKSKQKRLFVFAAAFLLLAFVAGAVVYKNQKSNEATQAYQRDKSTFVRAHSPASATPARKSRSSSFSIPHAKPAGVFPSSRS